MKEQKHIKVCTGKSCSERFSSYIVTRLHADVDFYKYDDSICIESSTCMGRCKEGPNVNFHGEIMSFQNPVKASEFLRKKVLEWKNNR